MQVPLEWKLSVQGASEVKSQMSQLQSSFDKGEISAAEYAKGLRTISRDARTFTNVSRSQNQIFMAMHPNINRMSKALSGLASVSRSMLSVTNALNLMWLRQGMSSGESELTAQINAVKRALILDPDNQTLREELSILEAKMKDFKADEFNQKISDVVTTVSSFAFLTGSIIANLPKLKEGLKGLTGVISGMSGKQIAGAAIAGIGAGLLGTGGIDAIIGKTDKLEDKLKAIGGTAMVGVGIALAVPEIAKIALIGTAIATATVAIIVFREEFSGFIAWISEQFLQIGDGINEFFTVTIPTAIGEAGLFLSNFFLNDLPAWANAGWKAVSDIFVNTWNNLMGFIEQGINGALKGFSDFVNFIIDGINAIIRGINTAFNSDIPEIGAFVVQNIKLPKINTGVESPAGGSTVGVGTGITNNITIMGTVMAEREFDSHIDDYLKTKLKNNGFTGY